MEQPDLLMVCATAMLVVFALLGLLALTMRVLIAVFPERPQGDDGAVVAAIVASAAAAYPGTKVANVKEIR